MGAQRKTTDGETNHIHDVESRPDFTAAARERRLIGLAYDEAERRLKDGTASSEMICHFLRVGSSKEYLDQQLMAGKIELQAAKTEMFKAQQKTEEMFVEAIAAMKSYQGNDEDL